MNYMKHKHCIINNKTSKMENQLHNRRWN